MPTTVVAVAKSKAEKDREFKGFIRQYKDAKALFEQRQKEGAPPSELAKYKKQMRQARRRALALYGAIAFAAAVAATAAYYFKGKDRRAPQLGEPIIGIVEREEVVVEVEPIDAALKRQFINDELLVWENEKLRPGIKVDDKTFKKVKDIKTALGMSTTIQNALNFIAADPAIDDRVSRLINRLGPDFTIPQMLFENPEGELVLDALVKKYVERK